MIDCIKKRTKIFHKDAIFWNGKIKNKWWKLWKILVCFCAYWNFDRKTTVKDDGKDCVIPGKEMIVRRGSAENGVGNEDFWKWKKPENSGKRDEKRAWQHSAAMLKYSHIGGHTHQPTLLQSIAQGKTDFNRNSQFWQILQAKCPVNGQKWCGFCSSWIRTEHF